MILFWYSGMTRNIKIATFHKSKNIDKINVDQSISSWIFATIAAPTNNAKIIMDMIKKIIFRCFEMLYVLEEWNC